MATYMLFFTNEAQLLLLTGGLERRKGAERIVGPDMYTAMPQFLSLLSVFFFFGRNGCCNSESVPAAELYVGAVADPTPSHCTVVFFFSKFQRVNHNNQVKSQLLLTGI